MKKIVLTVIATFSLPVQAMPNDFVYLSDVDASILQDMRYAGSHNFIGRPIKGYESGECILTRATAEALKNVQADLKKTGYSLKVYDCYRPQKAVDDFIAWSKKPEQQEMKAEFYPRVNKKDFFELGYVAEKSGHTRGSTVDITIVPFPSLKQISYSKQALTACFHSYEKRFRDNSVDMGTGYDCMDELSHSTNQQISRAAYENRQRLFWLMEKYGFVNLPTEWWHFTLKNERYPQEYFNFNVSANIPANITVPKKSRQLLLVRASGTGVFKADMQRYERSNDKQRWRAVGDLIPVVVGESGIATKGLKKEGDKRTPAGVYKISKAFGFEKNDGKLKLAYQQLTDNTVCVDDAASHFYNQIVNQSMSNTDWNSAEKMRQIPNYKIGAVIAFNEKQQPGLGSCIFMHIWRDPHKGTAGCVAMPEQALRATLTWVDPSKVPVIAIVAS